MNNIKWIIFDLGGIVIPETGHLITHKVANMINVPDDKLKEITGKFHRQITTGSTTLLDMYSLTVKELALTFHSDVLLEEHLKQFRLYGTNHYSDVVNFIKTLKQNYKVACLTNLEIEVADICRETKLFNYFDRAFLSTEMKMQKPDLEIYLKVIEELKCLPNEIIFTDDRIENVSAANKAGIHAFHYSNLEQLRSDISLLHC